MRSGVSLLAVVLAASSLALAGEETNAAPVVFATNVPLLSEPPGVAVKGRRLYYAVKDELRIRDLVTGANLTRLLGVQRAVEGTIESFVIGVTDEHAIVLLRHYSSPHRPPVTKGGGVWIPDGIEAGGIEIRRVHLAKDEVDTWLSLPANAQVAYRLLDSHLVYTLGTQLRFCSMGKEERVFELAESAQERPWVENGAAIVCGEKAVFIARSTDPAPVRLAYAEAPFSSRRISGQDIHFDGRRLLARCIGRTVALDLGGTEVWSFPMEGHIATGADGALCLIRERDGGRQAFRLNPEDGCLLWKQFIPYPPGEEYWDGIHAVLIHAGRLITPAEHDLHVLDMKDGRVRANLPWAQRLGNVKSCSTGDTSQRLVGDGDVIAIAFDESVSAIDLSPLTRGVQADPEQDAREPKQLLEAIEQSPRRRGIGGWRGKTRRENLIEILACHPRQEEVLPILEKIVAKPESYKEEVVESAAFHLRISNPLARSTPDERRLLFAAGRDETVVALGRKLTSDDKVVRAAALQLLEQASDDVILALEPVLGALKDDTDRQAAQRMITESKRRQEVIQRVPPLFEDKTLKR